MDKPIPATLKLNEVKLGELCLVHLTTDPSGFIGGASGGHLLSSVSLCLHSGMVCDFSASQRSCNHQAAAVGRGLSPEHRVPALSDK